jgi:hypothetical protein
MGNVLPEKKLLRTGLLLFVVFSFLLGIFLFILLRTEIPSKTLQRTVLPAIEKKVGRKVQVGEIHIHYFPTYLDIRSLKILDDKGPGHLLAAYQVKVYLEPWPLIRKRVQIRSIEVVKPQVALIRFADGTLNTAGLFPEHGPGRWEVSVGKVRIREGGIVFEDRQAGNRFHLSPVGATLIPDMAGRKVGTDFTGQGEIQVGGRALKGIRIVGNLAIDGNGEFQVRKLEATSPEGSSIRIEGNVRIPPVRAGGTLDGVAGKEEQGVAVDLETTSHMVLSEWIPLLLPGKAERMKPRGRLEWEGKVRGRFPDLAGEGQFVLSETDWKGVALREVSGKASYAEGDLRLSDVQADLLGGKVTGEGHIRLAGGKEYGVQAKGNGLRPGSRLARFVPPSVHLEENGVWDGEVQVEGTVGAWRSGHGHAAFSGAFPQEGTLHADIRVEKGGGFSADLSGESGDIRHLVQWDRLPLQGAISFKAKAEGTVESPQVQGTIRMTHITVRKSPLDEMETSFRYGNRLLEVEKLEISHGPALYRGKGRVLFSPPYALTDPFFDLEAEVIRGNPEEFVEFFYRPLPLAMTADGKLHFQGDLKNFSGTGDLDVTAGSAYGQTFERGQVGVTLEKDRIIFQNVRAEKGGSVLEGTGWIGFKGAFGMRLESRRVDLSDVPLWTQAFAAASGTATFHIEGEGTFHDPKIQGEGEILHLLVQGKDLGGVHLSLSENREGLQGKISLQEGAISGAGRIDWSPGLPFNLDMAIRDGKLDPFLSAWRLQWFSPLTLSATGRVEVAGQLRSPHRLQMTAEVQDLQAAYRDYFFQNDGPLLVAYQDGAVRFEGVKFKGEGTSLTLVGGLIPTERYEMFVTGEADLRLLTLLTREIDVRKGKAYLALMVRGAWDNPTVQGGLTIRDGAFRSTSLGQEIEGAEMAFFFNGKQVVLESLQGNLEGGSLKATGKIDIGNFFPGLVVERFGLVLELSHAIFRYPEGLVSRVNGTLVFQGNPEKKDLKGEILIEKATYDKRVELRSMILELRKAREQIGRERTTPFFGDTQLNIHLSGSRNIWVNNNLAKFPLQVDLALKGTVDRPQLFGNVTAQEGTFVFRRNDFKVVSATADFISTDTIRPVLDIHAQTRIREYLIDLRLTGTTDRFNLSLQSEPYLSETDILALLTVGQTAAEIAEAQTEIGATEATVLLAGPLQDKVEGEVQKITGVDRFQVEPYFSGSKAAGGARLTVGKRLLDDRMYVTYTTAFASEEDLIKLEYYLLQNVLLVGEKDENGRVSGDLKLRFEFR